MSIDPLIVSLAQAAPRAAEQQLLDIDGTVFVTAGLFLVMLVAMSQLVWKPYLKVRHERATRTDGYREQAEKLAADAEAAFERIEKELAEVRRQGAGELAMARTEAQRREQTLLAEAHAKSQKELDEARKKLDAALARQRESLDQKAAELGKQAAGKVLGRTVA